MVLRAIEQKIEALFEGVFGRAFRTNVQPVELARKIAKEMDDHRTVSVSRVYVPNEYTVYLSSADREQFEGYETSLLAELEEYIGEHAKRENYALLTPPRVLLETDDDLAVGEFGIATRMVQPRRGEPSGGEPVGQVETGATMIYKPKAPQPTEAVAPSSSVSSARWPRSRGTARRSASTSAGSSSGARGSATSRSRIRTCRAAMPSCARRGPRTGSSTSSRRTGSR